MGLVPALIFGDGTLAVYSYHLNSYKELVGSGEKTHILDILTLQDYNVLTLAPLETGEARLCTGETVSATATVATATVATATAANQQGPGPLESWKR